MLTYNLEAKAGETLCDLLANAIKRDILSRKINAGEKLPSKRNLAANLGISTITVERAYGQLVLEGYVQSIPKSGYFAIEKLPAPVKSGFSHFSSSPEESRPEFFADFASNSANPCDFPFDLWTKCIRKALSENRKELLTPSPAQGMYRLRAAISNHVREFRGLEASPENIVVGAGAEQLYAILAFLMGDRRICLENPGYDRALKIYAMSGKDICYANLDSSGISVGEIESLRCDAVHLSPGHQFPTGIVMPVSRRYEILAWAGKKDGRIVVEDDYDSEFRMQGRPLPALAGIDGEGKVVYLNTFSKSLSGTLRVAYMALPCALMQKYKASYSGLNCAVSVFEQTALAIFMESGAFGRHISRMRLRYRKKRDLLLKAISNSHLAKDAVVSEKESGLHFTMSLPRLENDGDFLAAAERRGVRLKPLSSYYHAGRAAGRSFMVNYSNIEEGKIEEAVHRLEEAWQEISG